MEKMWHEKQTTAVIESCHFTERVFYKSPSFRCSLSGLEEGF